MRLSILLIAIAVLATQAAVAADAAAQQQLATNAYLRGAKSALEALAKDVAACRSSGSRIS